MSCRSKDSSPPSQDTASFDVSTKEQNLMERWHTESLDLQEHADPRSNCCQEHIHLHGGAHNSHNQHRHHPACMYDSNVVSTRNE